MSDEYKLDPATELIMANAAIEVLTKALQDGELSDGYHTHNELYEHRMMLSLHAVHAWLAAGYPVVKSWRHSDGELCFGGGWFIVVAKLPLQGQVSYHYQEEHWGLFDIPEAETPPEYDGHTPADVTHRLKASSYIFADNMAELRQDSAKLNALYAGGVDNWEGYELSLEEMENADLRVRLVLAAIRPQPRSPGPSVHRLPHPAAGLVA